MKTVHLTLTAALLVGAAIGLAAIAPAGAQKTGKGNAKTPDSWSYEIRNGRRVPRGNRVTNPDGSWREEVRDGACVTVRTMSADREYREARECG